MDDKSLTDLVSQLLPNENDQPGGSSKDKASEQDNILIASLKAAAGQSGGLVETAVNQFLNGEGDLLATTRTAVTRGKTTAKNEVAAFLETKFKLSPVVAKLIAMLLVKLFPSISKLTGEASAEKKKPRKKKPKTSSSAKTTASSKKKPKKKKTTSRPKTTASKPAAKKKKPTAKGSKKETATKKKPKKKTRSTTVAGSPAEK